MIVPPQGLGVLLACREHRLVAVDVVGDPGHREVDGKGVVQIRHGSGGSTQWREKRRCPIQQKTSQAMPQPGKAMVGSISGLLVLACPGQRGSGQWLSLETRWTGPSRVKKWR